MGWAVATDGNPVDWERYQALFAQRYGASRGGKSATRQLHSMRVDDLIWSRNAKGNYYLGRVTSPWRYELDQGYLDADVVNVVDCEWVGSVHADTVPGAVTNAFISRATIQQVRGKEALAYSMQLFAETHGAGAEAPWSPEQWPSLKWDEELFQLLSPFDCEDLLGLHLQENGWVIIPNSCKLSTEAYEYVLHHRETGETAAVQVKQTRKPLDVTRFTDPTFDRFFLFATSGEYIGTPPANMICVDREAMREYLLTRAVHLSTRFQMWVELAEQLALDHPPPGTALSTD